MKQYNKKHLERIKYFINTSNKWLDKNRTNVKPITLIDVLDRLDSSSSLLSIEADVKTTKGSDKGYLTGILYLAPYNITGFNVCPSSKTCRTDCLFNAGRGVFGSVTRARIIKTLGFLLNPKAFENHLIKDIKSLKVKASNRGMLPIVRLNGTSDLRIEKVFKKTLELYSDIQFYDYTKVSYRFTKVLPDNYDLTFSFDGTNWDECRKILSQGGRVATVFKNGLPNSFDGFPVINGDNSDLRFLDGSGIIGLNAKGQAKKDTSDKLFIVDSIADVRCDTAFYTKVIG